MKLSLYLHVGWHEGSIKQDMYHVHNIRFTTLDSQGKCYRTPPKLHASSTTWQAYSSENDNPSSALWTQNTITFYNYTSTYLSASNNLSDDLLETSLSRSLITCHFEHKSPWRRFTKRQGMLKLQGTKLNYKNLESDKPRGESCTPSYWRTQSRCMGLPLQWAQTHHCLGVGFNQKLLSES